MGRQRTKELRDVDPRHHEALRLSRFEIRLPGSNSFETVEPGGSPILPRNEPRVDPIAPVAIDSVAAVGDDQPQTPRRCSRSQAPRDRDVNIPGRVAGTKQWRFYDENFVQIDLGDDARPPACALLGPDPRHEPLVRRIQLVRDL